MTSYETSQNPFYKEGLAQPAAEKSIIEDDQQFGALNLRASSPPGTARSNLIEPEMAE